MLIHITDIATTTLDIKEQQRINTCGVKDTYSKYVRWEHYNNMDKSLPLRPSMDSVAKGGGIRYTGFSLPYLMNVDRQSIIRVKHSMFLPCIDTVVVREYADEDLHVGTDLPVFSLV